VRDDLSPAQAAQTCEVDAESVANLVCAEVGVDTGEYSLPYVARWADGDVAVIRQSAERVLTAARSITETMLPDLDRWKEAELAISELESGGSAAPAISRPA
jgi:hypothetical protein